MGRDRLLKIKDDSQERLWREAKCNVVGYVALVHKKAKELARAGLTLKYAR